MFHHFLNMWPWTLFGYIVDWVILIVAVIYNWLIIHMTWFVDKRLIFLNVLQLIFTEIVHDCSFLTTYQSCFYRVCSNVWHLYLLIIIISHTNKITNCQRHSTNNFIFGRVVLIQHVIKDKLILTYLFLPAPVKTIYRIQSKLPL